MIGWRKSSAESLRANSLFDRMKSGAKDVVLEIWFDLRDAICGTGVFGEELVAHHSLGNRVAIFEIKFVESDVREIAAPQSGS